MTQEARQAAERLLAAGGERYNGVDNAQRQLRWPVTGRGSRCEPVSEANAGRHPARHVKGGCDGSGESWHRRGSRAQGRADPPAADHTSPRLPEQRQG
jgi:hypothetical protein